MRRSVGLRGYGQKDPLSEYKNEAFRAFEEMMGAMRSGVCSGSSVPPPTSQSSRTCFRPSTTWPRRPGRKARVKPGSTNSVQPPEVVRFRKQRRLLKSRPLPRPWCGMLRRSVETTLVHVVAERNTRNAAERESLLSSSSVLPSQPMPWARFARGGVFEPIHSHSTNPVFRIAWHRLPAWQSSRFVSGVE